MWHHIWQQLVARLNVEHFFQHIELSWLACAEICKVAVKCLLFVCLPVSEAALSYNTVYQQSGPAIMYKYVFQIAFS
jgi:hypothetical protein